MGLARAGSVAVAVHHVPIRGGSYVRKSKSRSKSTGARSTRCQGAHGHGGPASRHQPVAHTCFRTQPSPTLDPQDLNMFNYPGVDKELPSLERQI